MVPSLKQTAFLAPEAKKPKNPSVSGKNCWFQGGEPSHHVCILSGWDPIEKASQTSVQAMHRGENHGQCKMLIKFWFLFS